MCRSGERYSETGVLLDLVGADKRLPGPGSDPLLKGVIQMNIVGYQDTRLRKRRPDQVELEPHVLLCVQAVVDKEVDASD